MAANSFPLLARTTKTAKQLVEMAASFLNHIQNVAGGVDARSRDGGRGSEASGQCEDREDGALHFGRSNRKQVRVRILLDVGRDWWWIKRVCYYWT